mgnify:CR=1 FL=1
MDDSFAKFLTLMAKILIYAAIVPFVLIVGGLSLYQGYGWLTHGRYVNAITAAANNELDYPLSSRICKDEQAPIYVGFANESARTVKHIEILVDARAPGVAGNILEYPSKAEFDRIVKPGEHFGSCQKFEIRDALRAAAAGSKITYKAIVLSVRFAD